MTSRFSSSGTGTFRRTRRARLGAFGALLMFALGALFLVASAALAAPPHPLSGIWKSLDSLAWPAGTEILPCQNREVVLLLSATLRGRTGADTTGLFVLDT